MIYHMVKDTLLLQELQNNTEKQFEWFDLKRQKFVHNVDTLYYSVHIKADENALDYLFHILKKDNDKLEDNEVVISSLNEELIMNGYTFGIYRYDLELPDEFLYLIAEKVPNENTPHIIVQIRSYALWLYGQDNAVDKSLYILKQILNRLNIGIVDVKVNRIDYCWHTNYFQNTEAFLRMNNISKSCVTRFKEWDTRGRFIGEEGIETDYLRLGRLNSNNCLFRCYLKSKEVVEMGYKPWFFKIWLLNGLINRFDFYCYEEAFKRHNWDYIHKARMQFYIDHGKDQDLRKQFTRILEEDTMSAQDIKEKLSGIVPEVTLVLNYEFQVMRKFLSTIDLKPFASNRGSYEIYLTLELRKPITDYLTSNTLRFVEKTGDERKIRRDYAPFWKRLRQCEFMIEGYPEDSWPIIRQYTKNMNSDIVKLQSAKLACTLSAYNDRHFTCVQDDVIFLVSQLNDNDIRKLKGHKLKKINQLGLRGTQADLSNFTSALRIFDTETGEIF